MVVEKRTKYLSIYVYTRIWSVPVIIIFLHLTNTPRTSSVPQRLSKQTVNASGQLWSIDGQMFALVVWVRFFSGVWWPATPNFSLYIIAENAIKFQRKLVCTKRIRVYSNAESLYSCQSNYIQYLLCKCIFISNDDGGMISLSQSAIFNWHV